jgi:lipoate-protein ligase B
VDTILTVEHPRVITKGRRPSDQDFLVSPQDLQEQGFAIEEAGRGGKLTYHGPGQLVGYFIVSLRERKLSIPQFVRLLEDCLIQTMQIFKIDVGRRVGFPGVWFNGKKIGSIGLSIDRGVSMHGIALNVSPEMEDFAAIVPCGIPDCRMTSLKMELEHPPSMGEVEAIFQKIVLKNLN